MKSLACLLAAVMHTAAVHADDTRAQKTVLVRIDDVGMNHDSIVAAERVLKTGMPASVSVIIASPWYPQAVEMLKKYPNAAVGVHLTLNSEWRNFKRQPVLGGSAVPSLVDADGHFHDSVASFMTSKYKVKDIEKELRAQIERALKSGLTIDYLDTHMGMIYQADFPTLIRLSDAYRLGIALHFGETYCSLWAIPVEEKKKRLLSFIEDSTEDVIMVETHLSAGSDEMAVLVDANAALMKDADGNSIVGRHRSAELDAPLSPEVQAALGRTKTVSYRTFFAGRERKAMQRKMFKPATCS